jgi:hypothetical protein
MSRAYARIALAVLVAAPALAQTTPATQKIPVRPLGPIVATSTESIGDGAIVRGLPNGRVLVNAGIRQKVFSFDSTLKNFVVAMDSGVGLGTMPIRASALIPYTPDSTILVDFGSSSLLVLDPMGATARVMAAPRPQDLIAMSTPAQFGRATFDAKGRLFYRAYIQKPMAPTMTADGGAEVKPQPITADSSPIVRGDLDSRKIDTLAWVSAPSQGRMSMSQKPNGGAMVIKLELNPFQRSDEWALLTDGTIAIVRAHDYHIDWIDADGSRRTSPKMPFDWKRYTDDEKQHYADSIKVLVDSALKVQLAAVANQPGAPKLEAMAQIVPASEWPDYYSPVKGGSVLADLDNHVWILPTTSTEASKGFTYDVVNRDGDIIERVQLPLGRVITGFGPHGMVYLAHTDGKMVFLERALIRLPGAAAHSQ